MLESILLEVAEKHGTTPMAIMSRLRFAPHTTARVEVWERLLVEGWSYRRIAETFERCESSIRETIAQYGGRYKPSRVA